MLGNRIAPTPPLGDSSNRLADTVFVANALPFVRPETFGGIDDITAINSAVAALPAVGGIVLLRAGKTYKITSPIILGDGNSSTQSTKQGIYLVAENAPGGLQSSPPTTILYTGVSSANALIQLAGPISGWGLKNLSLQGNSNMANGLNVVAGCNGEVTDCVFQGFTGRPLQLTALTTGGTGHPDTQFNRFENLEIFLTNTANTIGVLIDGDNADANSNSSFNTFIHCNIVFPTANTSMQGFYLKACDSNAFISCSVFGGGTGTSGVVFDYTGTGISGAWPANNCFYNMDSAVNLSGGSSYSNVGSPGTSARPNRFYGISDTNSEVYPKLSNTTYNAELVNPGVDIAAQTASIGATNINPIALYLTGMYRISYYLEITTTGNNVNVSVTFGWTDDSGQAQTIASALIAANAKNFTQGSVAVRAASATNITYSTTVSAAIGTGQYALHVKLQKMD